MRVQVEANRARQADRQADEQAGKQPAAAEQMAGTAQPPRQTRPPSTATL